MGEQKRSLREFLRHVNDYTYRFDPEKGRFRYRELRGVRDTAFDFYMWLKCWKDMVAFVAKCPVSAVRALFRYQWFATYLTYPNFVDRGTLGMRGNQLRMARAQYDRIVKKATDLLRISFVADEHFHPGNKLSKKVVLFDELVPGEIMAGFPNLIYLPAQVLPVFLCSILDQQITPPYLDAAENFGIPADVCPLPSAEAGCALRDEYPKLGTCFVACNMPCDGSVATTSYQDRYFNLPTYYFGVPIRYNEEAVQDYAVEELRGLIRFIEEQTGETFDWDAFFKAMKVYNQETEYELQKWEVNRTPYPQMTGETFWIYRMFFYHLSGGMDPHFLDTDRQITVLAPENAWRELVKYGHGHNYVLMNPHTVWSEKNLTFYSVKAAHSDPSAVGFIIDDGNATYYIGGDTLYNYDVIDEVLELVEDGVDYAFLPINGVGNNMNARDAADFAYEIGAKHAIPVHYGLFDEIDPRTFDFDDAMIFLPYRAVEL